MSQSGLIIGGQGQATLFQRESPLSMTSSTPKKCHATKIILKSANLIVELAAFQCHVTHSFIKRLDIFLKSYGAIYIFAHRHLSESCLFLQGQTDDFCPRKLGQSAQKHFVFLPKISLSLPCRSLKIVMQPYDMISVWLHIILRRAPTPNPPP